jgi:hypothetical protein
MATLFCSIFQKIAHHAQSTLFDRRYFSYWLGSGVFCVECVRAHSHPAGACRYCAPAGHYPPGVAIHAIYAARVAMSNGSFVPFKPGMLRNLWGLKSGFCRRSLFLFTRQYPKIG